MADSKFGVAGVALLVLGVILFFGTLNYFNIISLSSLYPNQFGSLPHSGAQRPTASETNLPITCPVEKNFCNKGKDLYEGNKFLGIGYNLPIGKKIIASIPGTVVFGGAEDKSKGITSHAKIVIGGTGQSQGYVATYEYFGLPSNKNTQTKSVSYGEELGAVWGGSFPKTLPYGGINVLVIIKTNSGGDVHISQFE